jgi:hypothetical protein
MKVPLRRSMLLPRLDGLVLLELDFGVAERIDLNDILPPERVHEIGRDPAVSVPARSPSSWWRRLLS